MQKKTNSILDKIYAKRFDPKLTSALKKARLESDGARIIVAKKLTSKLLADLFERRICAIHIKNFCPAPVAKKAVEKILKQGKVKNWKLSKGSITTDMNYTIGTPGEIAIGSRAGTKKYISEANQVIHKIRDVFSPNLSPVDRLRLELDELWKSGANLGYFKGQKGYSGMVRVMTPKHLFQGIAQVKGVCHTDGTPKDRIFSANIYVSVPTAGGELSLWNVKIDKTVQNSNLIYLLLRQSAFDPEIQEVLHNLLPKPLTIRPSLGDLVILDSSRPHAVAGFEKGTRVSIQTFVKLVGDDNRIELIS